MADGKAEEAPNKDELVQQESADGNEPQAHEDGAVISVQNGPFQNYRLIENLPTELEFVQFEALDENIYLGTSTGDLLHYFEIEPRNYMLVSQTQFDSETSNPIDKILLLPKIERALVLCGGKLVIFLLPEFAPVPNTLQLKAVTDIALRSHSETSNSYKFYATSGDSIKLYRVTTKALTLSKNYDFDSVSKVVAQGHHLAVAKQNTYEILNLKTSGVTPLFRVSELNAPLRPIIANFNTDKFLVATGGESYSDSSMALVVNHHGDMVNGTIVLENYPIEVLVEYPYLIVNYGRIRVLIYKLNEQSTVAQEIKANGPSLRIAKTSKVFSGFRRPDVREKVVEKIRRVPLNQEENELKIDNERVSVEQIFEEESSVAVYGNFGIHLLIKNSPILDFTQYDEPGLNSIIEYLKESPKNELPKLTQLENDYLLTLKLLLLLLHCNEIDKAVLSEWCTASEVVDIRLLLYILGFEIFGNIWIFKGLVELIEKLKLLKLIHKCTDVKKLFHFISTEAMSKKSKTSQAELENIIKSIDVNIFKLEIGKDQNEMNIDFYSKCSLEEIAHLIEGRNDISLDLLLKINLRRGKLMDCIELLKSRNEVDKLLGFIEKNATMLLPSYKDFLMDDVLFIINSSNQVDRNLISHILHILFLMDADHRELLNRVSDNAKVKVLLIEELGPADAQDKKFLIEYYMAKIQECLQEENMWELLQNSAATYRQDMSYMKCSFKEFMMIKLRSEQRCQKLLKCYKTLEAINGLEDGDPLTSSMINMVKDFDKDNLLMLLFLPEGKCANQFLTEKELLHLYLAYNDFLSIEYYLTSENISQVLAHYTSFSKIQHSLDLATKLLQRNVNLIKNEETVRSVLKILPPDYTLNTLFDILLCILKRLDRDTKDLELRKALLKDEMSINHRLLKNFVIKKENK